MSHLKPIALFIFISALFITSCSTPRKNRYFQDLPESSPVLKLGKATFDEPRIQADDILSVYVTTLDPLATVPINSGNVPVTNSTISNGFSQPAIVGYLVDKDGNIEVPVLGRLNLEGLTTSEAKELIRAKANKFYNNPNVTVRFTNFRITVLGEVTRPSTYVIPNEKVSVLDALGYAGDLTIYAKRENVLLLRMRENGTREAYRLDLTSSKVLSSPYFYLKQQDVLYVEARKLKQRASDVDRGIIVGLITTALTITALFLRK